MGKKANIYGGGAQTNINGLSFEATTNLREGLENAGFIIEVKSKQVDNRDRLNNIKKTSQGKIRKTKTKYNAIMFEEVEIGILTGKVNFYKCFVDGFKCTRDNVISKRLEADEVIISHRNEIVYIIEKKYQKGPGSVDEKLQACLFKREYYEKFLEGTKYNVELLYILSDKFKDDSYIDTKKFMEKYNCKYYINDIPKGVIKL